MSHSAMGGSGLSNTNQRDNVLHDQFAFASHDCSPSSPVGMLPVDAIVLFVDADDIWCFLALAIGAYNNAVEIFDHSQTITS